jgi:hypothetical protein
MDVLPSSGVCRQSDSVVSTAKEAAGPEGTGAIAPLAPGATSLEVRLNIASALSWLLTWFGPTTVVAINPDSGSISGKWLGQTTLEEVTRWADEINRRGSNLYFCPNLPKPGLAKKPSDGEISEIRAIYADIDAKDGRSMDEAREAIFKLPHPTHVIMTGGGYQPIWILSEPLPTTVETIAWARARGKSIAAYAGGDAVDDISRILRLPFTVNYPNAKKCAAGRVECLSGLLRIGNAS